MLNTALESASLFFLVVIGWATVQTERRSRAESATGRLIRQLQEVYRCLLEMRNVWDKPPTVPTVISSQPITTAAGLAEKRAWEEYQSARDRVGRSLEVCLLAVPNCLDRLPVTWGSFYLPTPEAQRAELDDAIEETQAALIEVSVTPVRLGWRWRWSKK